MGDAYASHSEAATELGLALIAHIKEQDAKIQRDSDKLEMSQCASLVASVK